MDFELPSFSSLIRVARSPQVANLMWVCPDISMDGRFSCLALGFASKTCFYGRNESVLVFKGLSLSDDILSVL